MDTLISHSSALWALRRTRDGALGSSLRFSAQPVPANAPRAGDLSHVSLHLPGIYTMDGEPEFITRDPCGSRHGNGFVSHVFRTEVPQGSTIDFGGGVRCASPALLALLMAPDLSRLELTVLLSELMGLYSIVPEADGGMIQRSVSLAVPEDFERLLACVGSVNGASLLREALGDACVKSGSPRETKLSLRLGLSCSKKGYGLPVLSMNDPLEVERIGSHFDEHGIRRPDILIKAPNGRRRPGEFSGVAFEYNGSIHNTQRGLARDIRRSNELRAIGLKEYEIDAELYRDHGYMEDIAEHARRDAGFPRRHISAESAYLRRIRHEELYWELERIDGIHWGDKRRK